LLLISYDHISYDHQYMEKVMRPDRDSSMLSVQLTTWARGPGPAAEVAFTS